jgi:lactate dehydrogenase-like 2-hydroxyacid dehydrogenase
MTKPAVLLTGPMMELISDQLAKVFTLHQLEELAQHEALLTKVAGDIRAVCTGGHTGVKTEAALIARLPNLKIIANFGVGYDTVDVAAAAKRGVIVTNTPDVLTEEVADTAIGLLLMTLREFTRAENYLRQGRWVKEGDYRLTPASLRDREVGMVGYGRIGKAIARRIEAFGVPISYFGRHKQDNVRYRYFDNLVEMAKNVDTLVVITPGGRETENLINAQVLQALGPRGILINVARGTVVDEKALIKALRERTIFAAGLDVYRDEPNIDTELMALDNAVLLPHVGSASVYTRNQMGQLVVDNLVAFANGQPPKTPVVETPFRGW